MWLDVTPPDQLVWLDVAPPPDQALTPDQTIPLPLGSTCTLAGQCGSGLCVDSVCCSSTCTNKCKRCNLSGKKGTCSQAPAGTICKVGKCTGGYDQNKVQPPTICTLSGNCVDLDNTIGPVDCKEYRCDPVALVCYFPCSGNQQCKPGKQCKSGGKCDGTKRPLGASCSSNGSCESGYCVKSVCCDSQCTGATQTCAQPGARGACFDLKDGK